MQTRNDGAPSGLLSRLASRHPARSVGLVVVVFGLLLWARFLLVTGHPRTAIAEPPEPARQHQPALESHAAGQAPSEPETE